MSDIDAVMAVKGSPATTATMNRCGTPSTMMDISDASSPIDIFKAESHKAYSESVTMSLYCSEDSCDGTYASVDQITDTSVSHARNIWSELKTLERRCQDMSKAAKKLNDQYGALDAASKWDLWNDEHAMERLHETQASLQRFETTHQMLVDAFKIASAHGLEQLTRAEDACSHFLLAVPPFSEEEDPHRFCTEVRTNFTNLLSELAAWAALLQTSGDTSDVESGDVPELVMMCGSDVLTVTDSVR